MKSILDDPDLRGHADIHVQEDYLLKKVVEKGNIDMVHYLLTGLGESYDYIDDAFLQAMQGDQPDSVYYLLTSPEFQNQTDKRNNNTDALIWAAKNDHIDLVYQILDNEKLPINIYSKYEATFRNLYQNQQIEPIKKIIFEYDLTITPTISDILMESNGITEQVLQTFERRDCHYTLNQNLPIGNKINIKKKI